MPLGSIILFLVPALPVKNVSREWRMIGGHLFLSPLHIGGGGGGKFIHLPFLHIVIHDCGVIILVVKSAVLIVLAILS